MSFRMVLVPPYLEPDWPERIREAVPGATVEAFATVEDATEAIVDADAAYGTFPPAVFARAPRLRWIQAPLAGLGADWFHPDLVASDVVVTNMAGIYNEHLATHALAFVVAFARRFDRYLPQQAAGTWRRDEPMLDLASATVVIVGVGGSGTELGRLCAAFGMRVVGVDPRTTVAPEGFEAVATPDRLDTLLAEADFVVVTTPETPETRGMFDAARFARFRPGAYFVNIARGACVVTDDLVAALRSGQLGGAGLDVVAPEPLPADHPLWTMPQALLTPHVAIHGAPGWYERRTAILLDNCRRFAAGEPLRNVVDKTRWF